MCTAMSEVFFIAGKSETGMERGRTRERDDEESRDCEQMAWAAWVPQMTPTEPAVRTSQIAVLSMWLCGIPC